MAVVYSPRDRIWQGSNTATTGGAIFLTTVASAGAFNFRDLYTNGSVVALLLYDGTTGVFEFSYGTLVFGGGGAATDSITNRVITYSYSGVATPVAWGAGSRNAVGMAAARSFLLAENALGELTAPQVTTARTHLGLGTAATLNAGTAVNNLVQLLTGTPAKLPAVDGSNLVNLPAAAAPFPSGTKLFFGTAPPTGWTRINTVGDVLLKFATAAESPGGTGGSWPISGLTTPSWSTENYALTIADLAAHTHSIGSTLNILNGTGTAFTVNIPGSAVASGSVGSGAGHAHIINSMTIDSSGAWRPPYKVVVEASKD